MASDGLKSRVLTEKATDTSTENDEINRSTSSQPEPEFSPTQLNKMEKELRALIRKAEQRERVSSRKKRRVKNRQHFAEWKLKHRIPETPEQYWTRIMRVTQDTLRKKK